MLRTRIKICGLTRAGDVKAAVDAGADALGVVLAPSRRRLSIDDAAAILTEAPPAVARVGVFVDPDISFVEDAVRACGLTAVQLSGDETPEFCASLKLPVVKALHVGEGFSWDQAEPYRQRVAALLLDTYVAGLAGGTARPFRWHEVGKLPAWAPVFVAGGLTPGNVAECARALRPFAVDVSSGVEISPGVKDAEKIRKLCEAVREADAESAVADNQEGMR